jgi:hypothetical protein
MKTDGAGLDLNITGIGDVAIVTNGDFITAIRHSIAILQLQPLSWTITEVCNCLTSDTCKQIRGTELLPIYWTGSVVN